MNNKLQKIALRRDGLLLEVEAQRSQLAYVANELRRPLALADRGLCIVRYFRAHPILMVAGSAVLLKIARPSSLGKWMRRGVLVWQITRQLLVRH